MGDAIGRVQFFPVFDDTRITKAVLSNDLLGVNMRRLDKGTVIFPIVGNHAVRFFGIITQEGRIVSCFPPNISSMEQKTQYLNFVKERYNLIE